jgi:hypothetical protein
MTELSYDHAQAGKDKGEAGRVRNPGRNIQLFGMPVDTDSRGDASRGAKAANQSCTRTLAHLNASKNGA